MIASFVAGASWIVAMTTMFVSAQVALPDWVRGRGLAIFLTAYFGAMTVGQRALGRGREPRGPAVRARPPPPSARRWGSS